MSSNPGTQHKSVLQHLCKPQAVVNVILVLVLSCEWLEMVVAQVCRESSRAVGGIQRRDKVPKQAAWSILREVLGSFWIVAISVDLSNCLASLAHLTTDIPGTMLFGRHESPALSVTMVQMLSYWRGSGDYCVLIEVRRRFNCFTVE